MLVQRLASAAVGIPLIVLTIWVGGGLLAGVVGVAVCIACLEFASARGSARSPHALAGAALAGALPLAALHSGLWLTGALVGGVILASAAFTLSKDPHADLQAWLWDLASLLYFGALAAHFVLLRQSSDGRDWVFFVVLTVWTTDTGAYAVGRAIGRHKLAPSISPGKTVEGAVGSLIAGFAAVFALDAALGLDLALADRLALGLLLPPVIMFGDLTESALKRSLQIKDSSGLVPGHGGIADRLDSLLFAVPVVFYYLRLVIEG